MTIAADLSVFSQCAFHSVKRLPLDSMVRPAPGAVSVRVRLTDSNPRVNQEEELLRTAGSSKLFSASVAVGRQERCRDEPPFRCDPARGFSMVAP